MDVFDALMKYKHLMAEVNIPKYFEAMENWEKPCTEIEIYAHCKFPIDRERLPSDCINWEIDCKYDGREEYIITEQKW